jgi:hypothetical protein
MAAFGINTQVAILLDGQPLAKNFGTTNLIEISLETNKIIPTFKP